MHHVAGVAKEIDIELVVNLFIPLATKGDAQGLLVLFACADGVREGLV